MALPGREEAAGQAQGPAAPPAAPEEVVFSGKQAAALDNKNRVAFPAKFRGDVPAGTPFRAFPHPDGCIALYPEPEFRRLRDELRKRRETDGYSDDAVRELFSQTEKLVPDATHRILLTDELRQAVGITKDVMFVGVDNRIELWDAARWAEGNPHRQRSLQGHPRTVFR